MNEIIYLENDEEITSVIDRLRKAKEKSLALVIPRGGSLAQSIVNLKLLKKSASEMGKEISLVSNDRISRNLASQIGLTVYSKASEAEQAKPVKIEPLPVVAPEGDFKVNSYYGKEDNAATDDAIPIEEQGEELEPIGDGDEDIEELDVDDSAGEIDSEPTFTKIADRSEKIEKEDIEKAYKEPEDRQETRDKISPPMAGSRQNAGPDTNNRDKIKNERSSFKPQEHDGSKFGEPKERKPMSRNKKIALGVIGGVVVLLLGVSYFFLPYAKAKVMVKTEDLDVSESVTVNPQATAIDRENLIIPATTVGLEKEISKTYPTTGKKEMGEKATGKITIINDYDDKVKTIPAGTTFTSDAGKEFISLADASVPGLVVTFAPFTKTTGKVDVSVTAKAMGESYNIGPSHFNISSIPAAQKAAIYGQSASAMTGGTTKTVAIVSDADFKTAEADLTKSITELATTELTVKAKEENLEIITSKITSEVLSKEGSKSVNDEAANFDYRLKMKVLVVAYATADMKTALVASAEKKLANDKMLIGEDKYEVTAEYVKDLKPVDGGTATGQFEMKGTMKAKTGQKISESEIKDKIKGKKYAEAIATMQKFDQVQGATVDIWPSNIARVPYITSRIKVTFDYAQ